MTKKISLIIPCYNEEDVLPDSLAKLLLLVQKMQDETPLCYEITLYFVDDGSKDDTWSIVEQYTQKYAHVHGIKLAHNVGHQKALLAGLLTAQGDALISIDADLQDDITAIPLMIQSFLSGNDVVYGVRKSRKTDSFFKKSTAQSFYALMHKFGVDIVDNHADFRLLSRKAVEALRQYKEVNLFLRALIPLLGYNIDYVYYDRKKRLAGKSKYPLRKMLTFAWDGITSFSVFPLRIITLLGFFCAFFSALYAIYVVHQALFTDTLVEGWATTVILILFLGGIQLICIGILGQYIGKIYQEVKARPRFTIEKNTLSD